MTVPSLLSLTRQLERQAIDAHRRGEDWKTLWERIDDQVREVEPHDRRRYRRLYNRILHIWATGDSAGQRPVGNGVAQWDLDDQAHQG